MKQVSSYVGVIFIFLTALSAVRRTTSEGESIHICSEWLHSKAGWEISHYREWQTCDVVSLWGQQCTILDSLWFHKRYRHSRPPQLWRLKGSPIATVKCWHWLCTYVSHQHFYNTNTFGLHVYELIILLGGGGIGGGGTPRREGCQARDHWDISQPCLWRLKQLFWTGHRKSSQPNLWWLKVGISRQKWSFLNCKQVFFGGGFCC